MRKLLASAAATLLLVGAGCAPMDTKGPDGSPPPQPAPGAETPPAAAPPAGEEPGAGAGSGAAQGSAKLPGTYPKDFPAAMAGLKLTGVTVTNRVAPADARYQGVKATYEAKDVTPEKVVAYYESKLPAANPAKDPSADAWVRSPTRIDRNGSFITLRRYESSQWNPNKDGQIYVSTVEGTTYVTVELGVGRNDP